MNADNGCTMATRSHEPFMIHGELNDAGVLLLERNCFLQSFDTFRDALKAIRAEFQTRSSNDDSSAHQELDTRLCLETAKRRLASPDPHPVPPAAPVRSLRLQDLIASEDLDSVLALIRRGTSDDNSHIVLCANKATCADMCHNSVRLDLSAAIVTYNFGIAHQAYSTTLQHLQNNGDNGEGSRREQPRAAELFSLADTILENQSLLVLGNDAARGSLRRILVLRMIVLSALRCHCFGTRYADKVQDKISTVHFQLSALMRPLQQPKVYRMRNAAA